LLIFDYDKTIVSGRMSSKGVILSEDLIEKGAKKLKSTEPIPKPAESKSSAAAESEALENLGILLTCTSKSNSNLPEKLYNKHGGDLDAM